jgi:hypothetical protein
MCDDKSQNTFDIVLKIMMLAIWKDKILKIKLIINWIYFTYNWKVSLVNSTTIIPIAIINVLISLIQLRNIIA